MKKDIELIKEALNVLERIPCQFFACDGPTLRPIQMKTCVRCATVAKLQKRTGVYENRKTKQNQR